MPTKWVNDRNRERTNDDERGFADARRQMAASEAENQAEAEAFGERKFEEEAKERAMEDGWTGDRQDRGQAGGRSA